MNEPRFRAARDDELDHPGYGKWRPMFCVLGLHRWRWFRKGANQYQSDAYRCERCGELRG